MEEKKLATLCDTYLILFLLWWLFSPSFCSNLLHFFLFAFHLFFFNYIHRYHWTKICLFFQLYIAAQNTPRKSAEYWFRLLILTYKYRRQSFHNDDSLRTQENKSYDIVCPGKPSFWWRIRIIYRVRYLYFGSVGFSVCLTFAIYWHKLMVFVCVCVIVLYAVLKRKVDYKVEREEKWLIKHRPRLV